jgi:hypothetical protein
MPPGPHINSATNELATARVDENLMAMSYQCGGIQFYPRSPRISHSDANWATVDKSGQGSNFRTSKVIAEGQGDRTLSFWGRRGLKRWSDVSPESRDRVKNGSCGPTSGVRFTPLKRTSADTSITLLQHLASYRWPRKRTCFKAKAQQLIPQQVFSEIALV